METTELIEHLRIMGKHDDRDPNYYLLAADKLEELEEEVSQWVASYDMLNKRVGRRAYIDYWREKNGKDSLWYPDADEVYMDFFALKAEIAETKNRIVAVIKEYAKAAVDVGRESLDPVDDIVELLHIVEKVVGGET